MVSNWNLMGTSESFKCFIVRSIGAENYPENFSEKNLNASSLLKRELAIQTIFRNCTTEIQETHSRNQMSS